MQKFALAGAVVLAAAIIGCREETPLVEACYQDPTTITDLITIEVYPGDSIAIEDEIPHADTTNLVSCSGTNLSESTTYTSTSDMIVAFNGAESSTAKLVQVVVKPTATSAQYVPLVDLFTGADCPPCVAADTAFADAEAAYGDKVSFLEWHMSIPSFDEWSIEEFTGGARAEEWTREVGYLRENCCFTPYMIAGGYYPASSTTLPATLDAATASDAQSPYDMQVHAAYIQNGTSLSVEVRTVAHNFGAAETEYLNIAIVENNVQNKAGYYTYDAGITEFDAVVRQYTDALPQAINPGRNSFATVIPLDPSWFQFGITNLANIAVVAWLQPPVKQEETPESTTSYGASTVYLFGVRQSATAHEIGF
jgi:hypothetical protein